MFNYPFLRIGDNIYSKLGIKPDSRKDEINKAMGLYSKLTNQLIIQLEEYIEIKKDEASGTSIGDIAGMKNLKQRKEKKKTDLIRAGIDISDPEKEVERLKEEILEINSFEPGKTEKRDEYDLLFPPAILLRTRYHVPQIYNDKRTLLSVLREDLVSYFENVKKLNCYHPSDLSRKEFSSDFRHNNILDK